MIDLMFGQVFFIQLSLFDQMILQKFQIPTYKLNLTRQSNQIQISKFTTQINISMPIQQPSPIRISERRLLYQDTLTIEEMLEKAGNSDTYQLRIFLTYFLIFLFASFIQMGFPFIFRPAQFVCPEGQVCSEEQFCESGNYKLSDSVKSIAYTFDLVCDRKRILQTCFNAFLFGGFIGSLYYGQVIQRKGRRWGTIESTGIMVAGLLISLLAGNLTLFSLGVFLFNAGFRGFYNASLLTLSEVMNETSRASTPMVLAIGWASGQIIIAFICIWVSNWRLIFLYTLIPLTILTYYVHIYTLQSPRFLAVKHQFQQAKKVIEQIAIINSNKLSQYALKEQLDYREKIQGYNKIMLGGQLSTTQKHHSYASLFKFNSIRIRVIFVGCIWSIISLSYFISSHGQLNQDRSIGFNIAFAGVIEILAYFGSMVTSLNFGRIYVIKRLIILSAVIHVLFYFLDPNYSYTGFGKFIVVTLNIFVRILMAVGNTFLAIYVIELFPTSIRHYCLGMLGFITKLMYMLSFPFQHFWQKRWIHPNFIIGLLFVGSYFLTSKLRETKEHSFKDNLSEDNDGTLMDVLQADLF